MITDRCPQCDGEGFLNEEGPCKFCEYCRIMAEIVEEMRQENERYAPPQNPKENSICDPTGEISKRVVVADIPAFWTLRHLRSNYWWSRRLAILA